MANRAKILRCPACDAVIEQAGACVYCGSHVQLIPDPPPAKSDEIGGTSRDSASSTPRKRGRGASKRPSRSVGFWDWVAPASAAVSLVSSVGGLWGAVFLFFVFDKLFYIPLYFWGKCVSLALGAIVLAQAGALAGAFFSFLGGDRSRGWGLVVVATAVISSPLILLFAALAWDAVPGWGWSW